MSRKLQFKSPACSFWSGSFRCRTRRREKQDIVVRGFERAWLNIGNFLSDALDSDSSNALIAISVTAALVLSTLAFTTIGTVSVAKAATPTTALHSASPTDFPNGGNGSTDIAIDGIGDADGYHIRVAQESAGFTWHDLAVIKPANLDEAHWYGYQCLSSDGRYAAVAILPGTLENNAAGRNRGAFAYAIEVATGTVTPLATGVGSMYYSPSCGIDDSAVFTASLGNDEQTTQVLRVDLATGKQVSKSVVAGQVTSSVAVGPRIIGAFRSTLVEIAAGGTLDHPLHPMKTADVAGLAYQIRASQDGGIDFLTTDAKQKVSTVWHQANAPPTSLGSGPTQQVNIFPGRHGLNNVLGATSLKTNQTLRLEAATKLPLTVQTVSLDADAAFGPQKTPLPSTPSKVETGQTTTASSTSALEALKTHRLFKSNYGATSSGSTNQVGAQLPDQGPAISGRSSQLSPQMKTAAFVGTGAATSGYSGNISLASVAAMVPMLSAGATTPKCSIGRLLPTEQPMQPSNAQVNWAVQMAERGLLTGAAYTRPANYASMGLVAYAPSSDFPPVALSHPSSSTTTAVPRSVMEAIMAQESNFDQASWHAISGVAADPLIADYYGSAGGISSIYYPSADCGYGISQVTTGMAATDTSLSLHGQMKVAADYEENISAGLQILEKTWNQLYASGITANGGDPKFLENWFLATWAYNSGIQPTAAFGNTTGCTPSASCAGPDGTWGLGWSNNPANPNYVPGRAPFLQTSYADAAHPSSWPYEERIMGFMASALARNSHTAYATPTYNGGSTWIQIPSPSFFCTAGNFCSATPAFHCTLADSECWTHTPVTWVSSCSTTCTTSDYDVATTSTEPTYADPYPPECQLDASQVPSTASGAPIIVDDLQTPSQNRQGCGSFNWSNGGTFTMTPGTNSSGDPIGNIDLHQLGVGFGGHILFTHSEDGSNASLIDTGTWAPTLPSYQNYTIKVHLPDQAAVASDVVYTINPGGGGAAFKVRINQDWGINKWVDLGTFPMQAGGNVQLTNKSAMTPGVYDIAFDSMAFIPQGGTPGQPVGGPPHLVDAPTWSNPSFTNCTCGQATAGDPVNTGTGYFGEAATDISTPGRGLPLSLTRTYSSSLADPTGPSGSSALNGPFGQGWSFSYGLNASTNATTGAVTVHQEDGSAVSFSVNGTGYSTDLARFDATLSKSGSSYTFTRRGKTTYLFDVATGHLRSELDQAGLNAAPQYATTLAYDVGGNLTTVTDPGGRVYTFTWTGTHVTKVTTSASQEMDYGYNASGNLTDVYGVGTSRPGGIPGNQDRTQYSYNTLNLMTSERSPANFGKTVSPTPTTSMTYDSSERVTAQSDPIGDTTVFAYGPSAALGLAAGQTLITDPAGHQTLDAYSNGLLGSETRGYGTAVAATTTYAYDPLTLGVSLVTNPDGSTRSYAYDVHGNQTSSSDELGRTTSHSYDATGHVTQTTTPDLRQTTVTYNSAGAPTALVLARPGQSAEVVDGNLPPSSARTSSATYSDAAHPSDVTTSRDFNGNATSSLWDSAGDLTQVTDAASHITKYGYDLNRGLRIVTVSPMGVAAGTPTSCTPPATGCTTYRYDPWGHGVGTIDPNGHTIAAGFDADGNQLTSTDANNQTTTTTYDNADRPTTLSKPTAEVTTTSYNADRTVASTTDAASHATRYAYDAQARQVSATDPNNAVTSNTYSSRGQLLTQTSATGNVVHETWDTANQLTAVSYTGGTTTPPVSYTYALGGQRSSMIDGTGTTTYAYDSFGELTSTTTGSGSTVGYSYDADGHETSIAYPGTGNTVTRQFNTIGQLASIHDAANRITSFAYDADGAVTTRTDPNGNTETTAFDAAHHVTSNALAHGATALGTLTYTRDSAGNLATSVASSGAPGGSTTYGYNSNQYLTNSVVGSNTTTYSYDPSGNPVTLGGSTQVFDAASNLCWATSSSVTRPSCAGPGTGATIYGHNNNGQRTVKTPSTGTATTYAWNAAGELVGAAGTIASSYTYDGNGLRASKTVGTTATTFTWDNTAKIPQLLTDGSTNYIYGPNGETVEQTVTGGTTPLWYFTDQHGSTTALADSNGAVVGTYAYSAQGTVTTHTGTATSTLQYVGQYADSETGFTYLRARYYDPATALFVSVDALVAATLARFIYASNNPLNRSDPLGLEDWWNPTTYDAATWGWIGVGLGATALALTGVGLIADLGIGAAAAVSAGAFAASVAGETIDATTCATSGDGIACGGAVFNGLATIGGGASLLAGASLEGIDIALLPYAATGFGFNVGGAVKTQQESNNRNGCN